MKTSVLYLLLAVFAIPFLSCESDKSAAEADPVYKVEYTFSIDQGNYSDVELKYIDENGELISLVNPTLPWSFTINNAQTGLNYYVKSNYNAKPSAVFKSKTQLVFYKDAGITRNENCSQNFTNLTITAPLSCEGSGTLY
ncbi:MAG: hypothetical protein FGM16_02580 [Flavobacterium sp.]|nr:hypothetical protein [Flavobacterium sp.]